MPEREAYEQYQDEQHRAWEDEQAHLESESAAAMAQAESEGQPMTEGIREKIEEIAEALLSLGMLLGAPDGTSAGVFKRQAANLIFDYFAAEVEGMRPLTGKDVTSCEELKDFPCLDAQQRERDIAKAQIKSIADQLRAKGGLK